MGFCLRQCGRRLPVFDGMDKNRIAADWHSLGPMGIIGAKGNNAARAIHYAADNGARIINWSGFVDDLRPEKLAELRAAIEYAASKDVLVVVSAGNSGDNIDLDQKCTFPACFDTANLIKVAQIDFEGKLYRQPSNKSSGSNDGFTR